MSKVKAGVVLVTKFVRPGAKAFKGYVNYIDREAAVRNEYSDEWNGYVDYMGNPQKTSALFTAASDCLSEKNKQELKDQFIQAEENSNLMWQTVLSFDNRWLEEQGIYDSATNTLNSDKIRELTRNSMDRMLEKEGISESAVWSAAIHYNTDNIHIHIATVEPGQSQRPMRENGEPKGVWKKSTLNAGKSVVVNGILLQQEENKYLNDLIRNNIVGGKRDQAIAYDRELRQLFLKVYNELPENKQYWNYKSTNLGNQTRKDLDTLSWMFIQKYHADDYKKFQEVAQIQQDKYKTAYGAGNKVVNNYAANKEKELYTRLGNTILKEMKEYDRQLDQDEKVNKRMLHYALSKDINNHIIKSNSIQGGLNRMGQAMHQMSRAFRKDIQSVKNQMQYDNLQQKIEREKERL